MKFEKPAVSVPDQIELLKRRGMIVGDEAQAQHYLSFISYYRLRAYWLPFEVPAANNGDHAFRDGTTFEDVLTLYIFDRELRLLVLDAIERVEVALRAQWAHHMAMTYGPHGYLEQGNYAHIGRHASAVARVEQGIQPLARHLRYSLSRQIHLAEAAAGLDGGRGHVVRSTFEILQRSEVARR